MKSNSVYKSKLKKRTTRRGQRGDDNSCICHQYQEKAEVILCLAGLELGRH